MNIMDALGQPQRSFYEWHVKNGCGYAVEIDTELWKKNREEVRLISRIPHGLEKANKDK